MSSHDIGKPCHSMGRNGCSVQNIAYVIYPVHTLSIFQPTHSSSFDTKLQPSAPNPPVEDTVLSAHDPIPAISITPASRLTNAITCARTGPTLSCRSMMKSPASISMQDA